MSDAQPSPQNAETPEAENRYLLALRGKGELGDGSHLGIRIGDTVVLGRSRYCDWSLKRTPAWLRLPDDERTRIRGTLAWRATSRRHCRISYLAPDLVDVENLSTNGTFVDGRRIDRLVLTDCREQAHTIRLGPDGVTVELRPGASNGNG